MYNSIAVHIIGTESDVMEIPIDAETTMDLVVAIVASHLGLEMHLVRVLDLAGNSYPDDAVIVDLPLAEIGMFKAVVLREEGEMRTVLVVVAGGDPGDDAIEVQVPEDGTIDYVTAIVGSIVGHDPANISITDEHNRCFERDTRVWSLPLGQIAALRAVLGATASDMQGGPADVHQKAIMEDIRKRAIEENRDWAFEHMPEAYFSAPGLYVTVRVQNRPLRMLIDTGASVSILTLSAAESVGVEHLIDRRYRGVSVGIGRQRTLGRVHAVALLLGGRAFVSGFQVLEDSSGLEDGAILGLDWLMRNLATIDVGQRLLHLSDLTVRLEEPPPKVPRAAG